MSLLHHFWWTRLKGLNIAGMILPVLRRMKIMGWIVNVALVHNGIIENFRDLRDELEADGYSFASETDSEVVAHLVAKNRKAGMCPREAAHQAIKRLEGAFALAIMFKDESDLIVGARNGPPLAIGHGEGSMYIGSDAIALAPFTNKITYLEDGDWCVITKTKLEIMDMEGKPVERAMQLSIGSSLMVDKGNHRHFMQKEIFEQPEVISHTLSHYLDFGKCEARVQEDLPFDFAKLDRVAISACGTAFLAGLVGKYWFERYARLPVDIDIASEFRYREMPMAKNGLSLFISQSGETADTLACLRYCKSQGQHIGAVVNVRESTIARESDVVFPTLAGPEIGVASTKAFTCQLSTLASLSIAAGKARGTLTADEEHQLVRDLTEVPKFINKALKMEAEIEKVAPIALIDEDMPVVVIAPYDNIFDKTVSNMQEVAARGGRIILITDQKGADAASINADHTIIMPEVPEILTPLVYSMPIQLLAYHTAVLMGTDVDQPRNLAKSVTVE